MYQCNSTVLNFLLYTDQFELNLQEFLHPIYPHNISTFYHLLNIKNGNKILQIVSK